MNETCVGLWLDHKKAIFATCADNLQQMTSLHSRLGRRSKSTGGSRRALPYTYNGGGAADKKDHRREHVLHDFYDKVLRKLAGADRIYLMGPGLAKKELRRFLEARHYGTKIAGFADRDRLTERQIAAETRSFFRLPLPKHED